MNFSTTRWVMAGIVLPMLLAGPLATPARAQLPLETLPSTCCTTSTDYPSSGPPTATVTAPGTSPAGVLMDNIAGQVPNNGNATLNFSIGAGNLAIGNRPYAFGIMGSGMPDEIDTTFQASWTIGPTLNVTSAAGITLNAPAPQMLPYPLAYPLSSGLLALSIGANGYFQKANHTPSGSPVYNGAAGGPVTVTNAGSITIDANAPTNYGGAPWQPYSSAMAGVSAGGNGVGGKTNDNDIGGNGGNGGAVAVTTNSGSLITLQGSGSNGAPINGITAYSQGGGSGCDCSGDVANTHGLSGQGGPITVNHNGGIGVLAASSVGLSENTQSESNITGGPVMVDVNAGASIVSTGNGAFSIGVAAISTGNPDILQPFASGTVAPNGSGYSGPVSVTNNGSITTAGQLAVGIAALSLGGDGVFTQAGSGGVSNLGNAGYLPYDATGEAVSVTNGGSVTTNGGSAFGILAASNGAGGLIHAALNGTTGTGGSGTSGGNTWTSGVFVGAQNSSNNGGGGSVAVRLCGRI